MSWFFRFITFRTIVTSNIILKFVQSLKQDVKNFFQIHSMQEKLRAFLRKSIFSKVQ